MADGQLGSGGLEEDRDAASSQIDSPRLSLSVAQAPKGFLRGDINGKNSSELGDFQIFDVAPSILFSSTEIDFTRQDHLKHIPLLRN